MSEAERGTTEDKVAELREALREVIDPELGYNVVDLGLIYGIRVEDGRAEIVMTMTTPGCPAAAYIEEGVRQRALAVDGIRDVDVAVVWMPPWSPDMMSDEAKRHFGFA
ncbi:MAG: metal-sulfur cluster assembly factor [Clostridia bacterium]|nr:metal-sulfur cluster assembly factor [Clostridia bacterium]